MSSSSEVQLDMFDAGDSSPDTETSPLYSVDEIPADARPNARYTFADTEHSNAVTWNHGLHHYPAKFIPQIPRWALKYGELEKGATILDPFCGSGTTLVEAGLRGHSGVGIDINPVAALITKAKLSRLSCTEEEMRRQIEKVIDEANENVSDLEEKLKKNKEDESREGCLGMHWTWKNWFRPSELAKLLALRNAVRDTVEDRSIEIFIQACISSILKSCSYLSEDQVKVRYVEGKDISDPFFSFRSKVMDSFPDQKKLSDRLRSARCSFDVRVEDSRNMKIGDQSIERIITSPPYINAIDYTMAHKYNMFSMGFVDPKLFKDHCREYIGVTERAVWVSDIDSKPKAQNEYIQRDIDELWNMEDNVSRKRAYILNQYCRGMKDYLEESYRVLKSGGCAIMVVGENNFLRGKEIRTADHVHRIAENTGFHTELRFYHQIANRSSMRLNRNKSGGKIDLEYVYVFRKN